MTDISHGTTTLRPTRRGAGGRTYIGPKAQTAIPQEYFDVVAAEAEGRGLEMSAVWREIVEAGGRATGRWSASIAELMAPAGEV